MQTRTKITIAVGVLALGALLAWAFAPRPVEVETAIVSEGPFETTIDEDARTRLVDRYVVSAPLAGRLARIALREGDVVAAGQVVATLAPAPAPMLDERSRAEQSARIAAAEAAVLQARARIGAARGALERARTEQRRTEQLAQQGFVAPIKVDGDRLAVQASQRELDAAVEGEHVAGFELQVARAALAAAGGGRVPPAGFELRSPVAGRVLKVVQPNETVVGIGAPLLEIGDLARLEVVAELLTADALQAVPGRVVRIERWGGPADLAGVVRHVEPAAFTKVSALGVEEQRVNAVIDITSPREQWAALGDGFRVGVRIVTRSEPQVRRVPVSAVFPLPAGDPRAPGHAVFVVDSRRARLQPVTLGGRNPSVAWITDGLASGATVIVYPPAAVADGVPVRMRRR
ncbi:MAG: biotin/lipoyl-binding protein [Rubrivivax sp.]|nr:biotin/lipoyl-binding protein [Rubrivivax sp.]